jgi:hypothetical protein
MLQRELQLLLGKVLFLPIEKPVYGAMIRDFVGGHYTVVVNRSEQLTQCEGIRLNLAGHLHPGYHENPGLPGVVEHIHIAHPALLRENPYTEILRRQEVVLGKSLAVDAAP